MKKIILMAALFMSSLIFHQQANAQVRVNLGINIGSQPDWGPVGYDRANYYYMPDIDTYYDVPTHQFVYLQGNRWIHATSLPSRYRNYDLYRSYKVVVNEPNPWNNAANYRNRYANYRGHHDQQIIRDSRDAKYRNHWHGNGHVMQRGPGYPKDNNRRGHGRGY
ncbi:hypothetical protein HH214_08555 [Mucilaginibacter robiniae]|uniref:DUF3300 domain-containing protein n=1 Tax=Mucilaginibacter robiniae TaxID=2728022 RepID=A0A7L5DYQ8_9SPHI|nr:hypothetical protein [Mucilaginibacter robiniae]QJD95921.1 hypothetical protein HH214_08555 [Mucilaginibacter robiniae]